MMETYYGQVRTPADAIILFEACRLGLLPRVQRRLSDKERLSIRSGSVFVWDENEASMRRWTDGKSWSASRVAGSFLTYREMDGKRSSHSQGRAARLAKTAAMEANAKASDNDNGDAAAATGQQQQLQLQPAKVRKSSAKFSDPGSRSSQDNGDTARYKPDGLVKQSFSIVTSTGQHLHLISYYTRNTQDLNSYLKQPSTDPALAHIRPDHSLYPESSMNDHQNLPVVTRGPMNSVSGSYTPASGSQPSPGVQPYSTQSSGAPTPTTQAHAYPPPIPMAYLPQIQPNQGQVSSPHYLPPPTANGHTDPYAGYYPVPVSYMHPYYLRQYYDQQQQQQSPNQDCPAPSPEQAEQQQQGQQQPVYPHPCVYPPIVFGQGYPRPQDQEQAEQERSGDARQVGEHEGAKPEEVTPQPQPSSPKQQNVVPTEPRLESSTQPSAPSVEQGQQQQQQQQQQSFVSALSSSQPHIQTQTHVPSISSLIDPSSPHTQSNPISPMTTDPNANANASGSGNSNGTGNSNSNTIPDPNPNPNPNPQEPAPPQVSSPRP